MALAIFDKNTPVITDLVKSFSRNYATKDPLCDPVAADVERYDRTGYIIPHCP